MGADTLNGLKLVSGVGGGAVEAIRTLLGTSRSSVLPSIADFASVDTDGLKRRLKLTDRAREQGSKDLPATATDTLDPVEHEIIAEIEKIAREQHDLYQQHQKAYSDRAAEASPASSNWRPGSKGKGGP